METAVRWIAVPLGVLASLSTIVMMVGISLEVAFRNLQGRSIPGVLELSETALVITIFFGLAYAGLTGGHIAVDLLTSRLPEKAARACLLVAWVLSCIILVWLIYATYGRAASAFAGGEIRMGLVNWPLWPARWAIVVGLTSFLLVAVVNVVRLLRGQPVLGDEELHQIRTGKTPVQRTD